MDSYAPIDNSLKSERWCKIVKKNRNNVNDCSQKESRLMLSQLAALYLDGNDEVYRNRYIYELGRMGTSFQDANALFEFDCSVIKKHNKNYLLAPDFVNARFFELNEPFFKQYPKEKYDILNEQFLTISELCKIIDEAEYLYVNCHEESLSDEVWNEIFAWRMGGDGGVFAMKYFDMISEKSGASRESLSAASTLNGSYLRLYKWGDGDQKMEKPNIKIHRILIPLSILICFRIAYFLSLDIENELFIRILTYVFMGILAYWCYGVYRLIKFLMKLFKRKR